VSDLPILLQAAGAAGAGDNSLLQFLPLLLVLPLMYFLMIRPQSQRAKKHQTMLSSLKRNDTVVLSSGLIGKVTRIEETEVMLEIATGVNVRVVKALISEVRVKGEPAPANDSKVA
jgi:preprotein translocase subunit YajC